MSRAPHVPSVNRSGNLQCWHTWAFIASMLLELGAIVAVLIGNGGWL